MGLRPGRCYRAHSTPFTRQSQRRPRKSYVKGVPRPKIQQFQFNKPQKFDKTISLVAKREVQIRSEALEAARVMTAQQLEKHFAKVPYFFRVRPYPHQVIRENPLATGAGADRFQQGMRQSFGNPIGTAAQVREGQIVFELWVNKSQVPLGKKAMQSANYKLPTPCKIVVEDWKEGTSKTLAKE